MKFYKHYKNKPYKYIGVAKHSETLEDVVIYETRYENELGKVWVRPKRMFFEDVNVNGVTRPRFAAVPLEIREFTKLTAAQKDLIHSLSAKILQGPPAEKINALLENRTQFHLLFAYVDKEIAGFKLGYRDNDDKFISWLGGVLPEFRGLGLAAELMQKQHSWCVDQGFKRIQTHTKNKRRDKLILDIRFGFNIIGTFADEAGDVKIILEKNLTV